MQNAKDNPGVYAPPLVYVAMFFLSLLIQKFFPLDKSFFNTLTAQIIGIIFITTGVFINVPAILQFIKSKNTL